MSAPECENCGATIAAELARCAVCGTTRKRRARSYRWQTTVALTLLFLLTLTLASDWGSSLLHRAPAVGPSPAPPPAVEVSELRLKAERGEVLAQVALGDLLAAGRGVRPDYKQAAQWFRLAAAQGNAEAQNKLGMLCQAGQGVSQDDAEAVAHFRRAAGQGHVGAEYNLASAYGAGRGVPQNSEESARWYLKAAEHGDAYAQFNVGQRYELGRGLVADPVEAYAWYELAVRGSVEDARAGVKRLKEQLSAAQLREAQARVRKFESKRDATDTKP